MTNLLQMGQDAKAASRKLAILTTKQKNDALIAIAAEIEKNKQLILDENARDIEDGRKRGLSEAILDRLLLNEDRVQALADDTRKVADLDDPVGKEIDHRVMYNGMDLRRVRIPIGVLGVIYEARPNVTVDISALSLKTGNAVILRGGSETLRSNQALVSVIQTALKSVALPLKAVQYIDNPDRGLVTELLRLDEYVDMIIPRGGEGLHRLCREKSTIPVITGGIGICHMFVDETADLDRAVDIVENAKVQRPSVCNALDTLLVHESVAEQFLPEVAQRLWSDKVTLKADDESLKILKEQADNGKLNPAGENDFDTEWLDLILGVKVVKDIDEAIQHIQVHSTEHSDSILTENTINAERFMNEINSAAVFVNASTRFTDGGEFGLGAEVAVSTQKLHARGPMGLEELTTYKWIGVGKGHIRE